MRAVGITRFGGPEVLAVVELPEPYPEASQVRVRVMAATVNSTDTGLRSGWAAKKLEVIPPPWVPGMELAGIIDAIGPGADWSVGDRVMAIVIATRPLGGAQAEKVVVPSRSVARLPDGATFAEAATLPMNGLTARRALDFLGLRPGQTLAVTGAAGAVGGYGIELGKVAGLTVIVDAAPSDEALVKALGADLVVPRGPRCAAAILEAFPGGVDAVLDAALLGPAILPAIRDGGQLAAVRAFVGQTARGISIHHVLVSAYAENQAALSELSFLASQKKVTLRVAETFAPEQVADAHRKLEAGGVRGRMVITF
jgi:NADPH:quinone reductase